MQRNNLKLRNNSPFTYLCIALVITMGVMFTLTPSASAVSANLQLEIEGIECDLEALYGNSDPSTVIVPSYCNNAPEPPVVVVPQPATPIVPSSESLLINPPFASPIKDRSQNSGEAGGTAPSSPQSPDEEEDSSNQPHNMPTSFVEATLIIALLISITIVGSIVASGILKRPAHEIFNRIKLLFSTLFK